MTTTSYDTGRSNEHRDGCQHCWSPVHYGMTEHGYRGFIHDETGTAECPTTESVPS